MFQGDLPTSLERTCFLNAHRNGGSAELAFYEPPVADAATDEVLDLITYRTRGDGTIEAFVYEGPEFDEWLSYSCAGLIEVGPPVLFDVVDCTQPHTLD